jgi:integrase
MNPVQVLRDTSTLRSVKPRKNAVPLEQIGAWWSALTAMRADPALTRASWSAADCIALMAVTGLRIGEARSIRWDQLDLEAGTLKLTDTKNRTDATLPLSDVAVEILKGRPDDADYVFPARSGKGHLNDVRGQLEALADQTDIRVTAHDLRRTFIQVGFKGLQIELWRVKLLANHKVPKNDVTLDSYGDLSDRRFLKPEADRIAGFYEDQRRVFEADNVLSMEGRA